MAYKSLGFIVSSALLVQAALLADTASDVTQASNNKVLQELNFGNRQDFEDANRGLIAPLPNGGIIRNDKGEIVWDLSRWDFLGTNQPSPPTVNPSLWRQGQLLHAAGLYKVTDRIYQVRGADLSNMTIIEGDTGIIVIDPLISMETAKAALALYFQNRPHKAIKAVIYSHSHVDHFGGVKGIISQQDVDSGKIEVIAPAGFLDAALDENVMAGTAMGRRAGYMYGNLLKPGPTGQVTSGLGLTTSTGEVSLIAPTKLITETGEKLTVDGVDFVFIMAPDSEAPAEMLFYLPQFKALDIAEDASHTMHNLYSLRGAKIRDARAWARYLNQAIAMFGPQMEIVFGQHHWPVWGNARANDYIEKQRDMYKYLHDQSLRLANQGYTMLEVGEMVKLPKSLDQEWYNRGYYGSTNHNAKAVYNLYLGWFDGNPSTLHQLPPVEASKQYVKYMGGASAVLDKARDDYKNGNYRWVAQVVNHVVYADPSNKAAKDFLADTLEQLGYQAENGTWRNFYLSGAQELRQGVKPTQTPNPASPDMVAAMPTELLLDYLAVRLDGPRASENPVSFNLVFPDKKESFFVQVKNGVLNYFKDKTGKADATITVKRSDLNAIITGQQTIKGLTDSKKLVMEGNQKTLTNFLGLLDAFPFWFNIVEPRPAQQDNS